MMRTWLLLPSVALGARSAEQVGMMQVKTSMEAVSMHTESGSAVNSMLQTVRELAAKSEKPSADTITALNTIKGLVAQVFGHLGTEKTSLQGRADASTDAIVACDSAWTTANGHKGTAEQTMNTDKTDHSQCRTAESGDLTDQTTKCGTMNTFHSTTLTNNVCEEPQKFDRKNSVTYMKCINDYYKAYATQNTEKIKACTDAETEYDRQHGECNGKQGVFEEAACAHYTTHATMCTSYDECRPPAVQDFESKVEAIKLEETSLKNQHKVLKTVECYVTTMLDDNSDNTDAALTCEGPQEYSTAEYDITYPTEPGAKPCTVGTRPCQSDFISDSYSNLPADAPHTGCAECPVYPPEEPADAGN